MAKSVNEYYSEKMKKLLEMQEMQNTARLSSPEARPSNNEPPQGGRGYYDNFRTRVASPAAERQAPKNRSKSRDPLARDVIDDVRKGRAPRANRPQENRPPVNGQKQRQYDAYSNEKKRPRINPEQTAKDKYEEHLRQIEAIRTAKRARVLRKVRDGVISFTLITAVLVVMCIVVYRLLFVISDVSAVGSSEYSSDELVTASGVSEGDHLFSFSSREVGELMTLRCPEISEVDVERTPPGTIVFNVTEESPAFYADFYGEYRLLSESLRVLGSVTEADAKENGCIRIIIPDVLHATAGHTPEFSDVRDDAYIYETASAVLDSSLGARAGTLDLSDKYNITLTVDGKYILKLGDSESIATKLRIATAVLKDEMFNGDTKATIDVTDLSETSVVEDQGLTVD